MSPSFEYVLPAIRGIQAGREYYVSMCPIRFLPKFFPVETEELPATKRASRSLNRQRVPEMARYLLENPKQYAVGAIAASIDAEITFEPLGTEQEGRKVGRLRVPMDARWTINDGLHRRAAFEMALKENPELGYETVALILYLDLGLEQSQQIFVDFNSSQVGIDSSLQVLYNHRDQSAKLVKAVVQQVEVFRSLTEMERSVVPARSQKLFTLSSLYHATLTLLANSQEIERAQQVELAVSFWNTVSAWIPDWQLVLQGRVAAGELRQNYLHSHPIVLAALAEVGASLFQKWPGCWEEKLMFLHEIDWSLSNPDWQGKVLSKGGVSKSRSSVSWLRDYLKHRLVLENHR